MGNEATPLDELSREIRKLIADNLKFLEKVHDDEFEPDEDDLDAPPEVEL